MSDRQHIWTSGDRRNQSRQPLPRSAVYVPPPPRLKIKLLAVGMARVNNASLAERAMNWLTKKEAA